MRRDDSGSITLMAAVLAVVLLAFVGLVSAGSDANAAKSRADALAFEAARAGAQALSPESLAVGSPRLDAQAAYAAAERVLVANHAVGRVAVGDLSVSVTIEAQVPAGLLGFLGVRTLTVRGSAPVKATPGP
jgi:Flp pilus assembly protein TadG